MSTDTYHPDPLAQARANIEMMRDVAYGSNAWGRVEALNQALYAIDAELAAAPTVTIPKPQPDDSGLIPLITGICLGAVSMLVVVGVIRWVL